MTEDFKVISNQFVNTVCSRLVENKQVRRSLPIWGRVHIDRQLPFLCIYRRVNDDDNSLSERLILGEASYLIATGNKKQQRRLSFLVKRIAETLKKSFGTFLIVEVWINEIEDSENLLPANTPAFKIYRPKKTDISLTIERLQKELLKIKIRKETSKVDIVESTKIAPAKLPPLLTSAEVKEIGCHLLGIEVRPIYHNQETNQAFPIIRRELQRGFAKALKNSFFEFTHNHTTHRPRNYQSLGRHSMVKAVWEIDEQLAEICNGFDFLLQVTPINSSSAWSEFDRNHFEKVPEFNYRPLTIDPALSKRRLYQVPIERIEDPTLSQLFREQQLELDRKFTMLIDRGTPNFLYGSLQLYGAVDDSLMNLAQDLLEQLPPRSREKSSGNKVDAKTFAERAKKELDYFRDTYPQHKSRVVVREDITGLMVSQGNLLIGAQLKIPEARTEALIQHEVGTHILTYLNGKAQPFRQLNIGLAGYEELQEGLAVLSEYLVGGLSRPRLRLLAARVIAARHLTNGANFIDVFQQLNKNYGIERRTAFNITTRTFRCGGLTKDAVYLEGLVKLLEYLKTGGQLEPLFIGKISVDHVPIVNELIWRRVLQPPLLKPRYLNDPEVTKKLKGLQAGISPINLINRSKS